MLVQLHEAHTSLVDECCTWVRVYPKGDDVWLGLVKFRVKVDVKVRVRV